jgi:vacuolar-type H+-ATPase subunit E/Vma4
LTVSVEDKIELFRNIIFKNIEESGSVEKLRVKENFEQEKNKLLKEVEAEKKQIVEGARKKAEKEKQQLIAKAKSQAYHHMLEKRQQFIHEITGILIQKAKSFVSEEGYKEYLSKRLDKTAAIFYDSVSVQLYFTKRDLKVLGEFINQRISSGELKGRFILKETGDSILGGFYAEDDKQEMQVDYTLKSLIQENRELIGSSISHRLDEVQGNG